MLSIFNSPKYLANTAGRASASAIHPPTIQTTNCPPIYKMKDLFIQQLQSKYRLNLLFTQCSNHHNGLIIFDCPQLPSETIDYCLTYATSGSAPILLVKLYPRGTIQPLLQPINTHQLFVAQGTAERCMQVQSFIAATQQHQAENSNAVEENINTAKL